MLLTRIEISGWRSFSPDYPLILEDLGRVNLIIGPNNVGKSNVGRCLARLQKIISANMGTIKPWQKDGDDWRCLEVFFEAEEVDYWLRSVSKVELTLDVVAEHLGSPSPLPRFIQSNETVRFGSTLSRNNGNGGLMSLTPLSADGKPVMTLNEGVKKLRISDTDYTDQITAEHTHKGLGPAACLCFSNSIIQILPLRDTSRKSAKVGTKLVTDGGDVIERLQTAQEDKNKQSAWLKVHEDLEQWFGRLLDEPDLRFDVTQSGVSLRCKRGANSLICRLEDLGAGVSELLMLLAFLRLHTDRTFLVIIDEPESHLHPGAAVELLKIIHHNMPHHQLLVTTHSTALVDAMEDDWKLIRMYRGSAGNTMAEEVSSRKVELNLLQDLGIRPSQLFLPKAVLWVEGPSDVSYWTGLLAHADGSLLEGRDFAFVMYGGSSIANVTWNREDDDDGNGAGPEATDKTADPLVEMLRVSHRAAVICDRDANVGEPLKDVVERLKSAAKVLSKNARVVTSCGREIENDVHPSVLVDLLKEAAPRSVTNQDGTRATLDYADFELGPDDDFNHVVANAATRTDGKPLSKKQKGRIRTRLDEKKTSMARRVLKIAREGKKEVFRLQALEQAGGLVKWIRSS